MKDMKHDAEHPMLDVQRPTSNEGAVVVVVVVVGLVHVVVVMARSLRITCPVARNVRRARSASVGMCEFPRESREIFFGNSTARNGAGCGKLLRRGGDGGWDW